MNCFLTEMIDNASLEGDRFPDTNGHSSGIEDDTQYFQAVVK